ncbi:hypothetical protein YB2330_006561 [Saitoella coloradoensis]
MSEIGRTPPTTDDFDLRCDVGNAEYVYRYSIEDPPVPVITPALPSPENNGQGKKDVTVIAGEPDDYVL